MRASSQANPTMATSAEAKHAPDDPGLFSWVLAVLLWAECLVALVAAFRSTGRGQLLLFVVYGALLAAAAVARSGPLTWMRPVTWAAVVAVAIMHVAAWALSLGRQSPGPWELILYGVGLAGCAFMLVRETPLPRDHALPGWARMLEVTSRAVGLGFLAGVLLMFLDGVVRLPFSGH